MKNNEKKSFRKFFKFTVLDAFEWKDRISKVKVRIPESGEGNLVP